MANQNSKRSPLDHLIVYIAVIVIHVLMMKMSEASHVGQGSFNDTEFCEVSKLTRTVVKNCPEDYAGVMEAANRKNCSAIKSTCLGRLEYHCVINPWGNLTVEVCAPATLINKGYCAEYNEGGGNVQENHINLCSECRERYLSTDAYKYPGCYTKLKDKNGFEKNASGSNFPYVSSSANNRIFGDSQLFYIPMLLHVL